MKIHESMNARTLTIINEIQQASALALAIYPRTTSRASEEH